jgi:hypothetical protein
MWIIIYGGYGKAYGIAHIRWIWFIGLFVFSVGLPNKIIPCPNTQMSKAYYLCWLLPEAALP